MGQCEDKKRMKKAIARTKAKELQALKDKKYAKVKSGEIIKK